MQVHSWDFDRGPPHLRFILCSSRDVGEFVPRHLDFKLRACDIDVLGSFGPRDIHSVRRDLLGDGDGPALRPGLLSLCCILRLQPWLDFRGVNPLVFLVVSTLGMKGIY